MPKILTHKIIDTLCSFKKEDKSEMILTQVIQILLNIYISRNYYIHSSSLMKLVYTCFQINASSKYSSVAAVAKTALIQIMNTIVFQVDKLFLLINGSIDETINKVLDTQKENPKQERQVSISPNPDKEQVTLFKDLSQQENDVSSSSNQGSPMVNTEIVGDSSSLRDYSDSLNKDVVLLLKVLSKVALYRKSSNEIKKDNLSESEDLSCFELKVRRLATELIIVILNNSGVSLKSRSEFLREIRNHVCVPIIRNNDTLDKNLFELTNSAFLILVRSYRSTLKHEIGILIDNKCTLLLNQDEKNLWKKITTLYTLGKLCRNFYVLADIYLNYDCDIKSISLFERIVSTCSKISQTPSLARGSMMFPRFSTGGRFFDKKLSFAESQIQEIKSLSLSCLMIITYTILIWVNSHFDSGLVKGLNDSQVHVSGTFSLEKEENVEDKTGTSANDVTPTHLLTHIRNTNKVKPTIPSVHPLDTVSMDSDFSEAYAVTKLMPQNLAATEGSEPDPKNLISRKTLFLDLLKRFNMDPSNTLPLLMKNGFVGSDTEAVAQFFLTQQGLSKKAIGEYLGNSDNFSVEVMHKFTDLFDFTNMDLVHAMRVFLDAFQLPGEAQKIDRIIEKFSNRYYHNNPDKFSGADALYSLSFSIIMLNTDLHLPQIKNKITKTEYIRMNKCIQDSGISESYLSKIYDEISKKELKLTGKTQLGTAVHFSRSLESNESLSISSDSNAIYHETFAREYSHFNKIQQPGGKNNNETDMKTFDLAKLMFSSVLWPLSVSTSVILEPLNDKFQSDSTSQFSKLVNFSLYGLVMSVYLTGFFGMDIECKALMGKIDKSTNLAKETPLNLRNYKALCSLLYIAVNMGEYIGNGWVLIIATILRLYRLKSAYGYITRDNKTISPDDTISPDSEGTSAELSVSNNKTNIRKRSNSNFYEKPQMCLMDLDDLSSSKDMTSNFDIFNIDPNDLFQVINTIFENSIYLSHSSHMKLVKAICDVSLFELGLDQSIQTIVPTSTLIDLNIQDEIYTLNLIVNIASYSMERIRFEWDQVWIVLRNYFVNIFKCKKEVVINAAINSIGQIAIKFLERRELEHYSSQSEILLTLRLALQNELFRSSVNTIVNNIIQIIKISSPDIRSGWKAICNLIKDISEVKVDGKDSNAEVLNIMEFICRNNYLVNLLNCGYFSLFVETVGHFVTIEGSSIGDKLVVDSMSIIKLCLNFLITYTASSSESTDNDKDLNKDLINANLSGELGKLKVSSVLEQSEQTKSIMVSMGKVLCRIIEKSRKPYICAKSVDLFFSIWTLLKKDFDPEIWISIQTEFFDCVKKNITVHPPLIDITGGNITRRDLMDSDIVIIKRCLSYYLDLFSEFYEKIISYKDGKIVVDFTNLLIELIGMQEMQISLIAINYIYRLVIFNVYYFNKYHKSWDIFTECLENAFKLTVSKSLLDIEYAEKTQKAWFKFIDTKRAEGGEIGTVEVQSVVETLDLDILDFFNIPQKCGLHLNLISFIGDILYMQIEIPVDPLERSSFKLRNVPENSEILEKYPFQGIQKSDDPSKYTQSRLAVVFPRNVLKKVLSLIHESYKIARSFNSNNELRNVIFKYEMFSQTPHLTKQELTALGKYIGISLIIIGDMMSRPITNEIVTFANEIISPFVNYAPDTLEKFIKTFYDIPKNKSSFEQWMLTIMTILDGVTGLISTLKTNGKNRLSLEDFKETLIPVIIRYYRLTVEIALLNAPGLALSAKSFLLTIGDLYIDQQAIA